MVILRRESSIERKVCRDALKKWGIKSIKLNGRGQTGWPDREFLIFGGRSLYIEFKKSGGRCTAKQQRILRWLKGNGNAVAVHDSAEDALKDIQMGNTGYRPNNKLESFL